MSVKTLEARESVTDETLDCPQRIDIGIDEGPFGIEKDDGKRHGSIAVSGELKPI